MTDLTGWNLFNSGQSSDLTFRNQAYYLHQYEATSYMQHKYQLFLEVNHMHQSQWCRMWHKHKTVSHPAMEDETVKTVWDLSRHLFDIFPLFSNLRLTNSSCPRCKYANVWLTGAIANNLYMHTMKCLAEITTSNLWLDGVLHHNF